MNEAIRHYADIDSYYNGSEGTWTVCGLDWWATPRSDGVVTDCAECVKLRQERVERAKADWR